MGCRGELPLGVSLQQLRGGGDLQISGCGLQHQGHMESPSLLLQEILYPLTIPYDGGSRTERFVLTWRLGLVGSQWAERVS